jgi:phosphoadenosine phosphosulfate reductase
MHAGPEANDDVAVAVTRPGTDRAPLTAAQFEARHGGLREQGCDGLTRYDEIVKLEPFRHALHELGARSGFSGLRRVQSTARRGLRGLED